MNKMMTALALTTALCAAGTAWADDKVVFGTNWLPQGGHGGFYQALADGTYKKHGLDVEIMPGGPQVNNRPMLSAGRLDFLLGGNLLLSFDNVKNGIPTTVVAAFYQKEPQALIAHKGKYADWQALTTAPTVLVGKDGQFSFWQWMVSSQGFKNEQLRPYAYNLAQFLSDDAMVQQAYATAEPIYAAEQGVETDTFLLADQGWNTYANTIETRQELIDQNPELVQRFLDASIEGWYNFLYGDHTAAYEMIIAANPELTAEKLDKEVALIKELGIVDSGESLEKGLGAMDEARVKSFLDTAIASGLYKDGEVDLTKVANYTFVNKGHGLDIKEKLEAQ
ncbi:ABC transporter substrate-binding protein [Paracoccus sulfuroxidans]|uniref:NitT/TauT family transport system substrate-binding protein n=1 Tax=Paracoccus sulfuroxidans TaxID=384678 RepID=A0A562NYZ0_9RHOB|nr:ABC transporter substrate-binding protein [Paracoccus sulfuroxidans]TWI36936.1 NitT/TauT family transport system substrate-binding protein [Paracoccus sulfuroxidans]